MDEAVIAQAQKESDLLAVRGLWREYWTSFGLSDDFQGFGRELEGLPGAYGQPGGLLLLALIKGEPAGTIALRRLDETSGEVKRLYLRPECRGRGLGWQLLETVIKQANSIGYECLYADTLPIMKDALKLYERAGFQRIEAYSNTPTPGAIYMKLRIVEAAL